MSEKNGNGSAAKPDLVALREEIRQTRADLGETVQALAAKADVKARAREQVAQTREKVRTQAVVVTDRVRAAARNVAASPAGISDQDPGVRAKAFPAVLVVAGLAAVVGVILIVRGRR
ncbi:DUF3618 domain-containing protein [Actinoplanes sp. NPDC051861]|uniref:DUF3618 domain-containing protein n=1 Tax=Actinoplanes sp. NPDC051861 TaxID=3155170 RepID=UPI0034130C63